MSKGWSTCALEVTQAFTLSWDNFINSNDLDILVVGKAFDAHTFHKNSDHASSQVYLTGRTCPWNTLAVWDVSKLARVSVPYFLLQPVSYEVY
jgi:hypothetical protein